MNFGGSFFGSFPTAGALSRTVLQDATGGNTQLVGCISSGIVILVILFLGSLFGPLPSVRDYSNLDTIGADSSVLNSEVSLIQRLLSIQMWHLRTDESVLFIEVSSSLEAFHCISYAHILRSNSY